MFLVGTSFPHASHGNDLGVCPSICCCTLLRFTLCRARAAPCHDNPNLSKINYAWFAIKVGWLDRNSISSRKATWKLRNYNYLVFPFVSSGKGGEIEKTHNTADCCFAGLRRLCLVSLLVLSRLDEGTASFDSWTVPSIHRFHAVPQNQRRRVDICCRCSVGFGVDWSFGKTHKNCVKGLLLQQRLAP